VNPPEDPVPDLEARGSWTADSVRWRTVTRADVKTTGDLDTEHLREGEGVDANTAMNRAQRGITRRRRFSAWLRQPRS
jgi:hypothetical protein